MHLCINKYSNSPVLCRNLFFLAFSYSGSVVLGIGVMKVRNLNKKLLGWVGGDIQCIMSELKNSCDMT